MSITGASLMMMLNSGGGSPAPPQPTIVGTDKVYKAWQIRYTDLFVGVGQCVGALNSGSLNYLLSKNLETEEFTPYSFVWTVMWGKVVNGKAAIIYGLSDYEGERYYQNGQMIDGHQISYDYAKFMLNGQETTRRPYPVATAYGFNGWSINFANSPDLWIFGAESVLCKLETTKIFIINFDPNSDPMEFSDTSERHNIFPSREMLKELLIDNPTAGKGRIQFVEIDIDPAIKAETLLSGICEDPSW